MEKRPGILIIEARHNIRTFLEMTLSQAGARVFSAVNLASALLQLRVLQPDLIILGLGQAEHEECAALAQIRALSASPLLALASDSDTALPPGIAAILPYPYQVGQLCATVARLLEGRDEPRLGHCECGAGYDSIDRRM